VIGKVADAEYHTPGAELTGGEVKHAERIITIDDLLVTHKSIANIDEAKNRHNGSYLH
jgi:adenine/guanine phosphoribosyltransferase-like PRPP-binding protein